MNQKVVDAVNSHVSKINELKEKARKSSNFRREAMQFSSNWAVRQAAAVDFLVTHEELELYAGALLSAKDKIRKMG